MRIAFTTQQAKGAMPNGTRIVKVKTEKGDANPVGTKGVIVGSLGHPSLADIGYFVKWDSAPDIPMVVLSWKIAREQ